MKEITKYQCEICSNLHDSPVEANRCEARGKEIPIVKLFQEVEYKFYVEGTLQWADATVYDMRDAGHHFIYELGTNDNEEDMPIEYYPRESVCGNESFINFCRWK